MNQYYYSGLRVRSEFVLPEWEAFELSAFFEEADVIFRRVERLPHPAEFPGAKRLGEGIWSYATPDQVCYLFPEAGRFRIREGREILVAPEPDAGDREIRLFLLGSAWGALCYQRRLLVLHAGVVKTGDGAAAFFGPSGSGKSAIVARLVSDGYPLVADDLCRFDVSNAETGNVSEADVASRRTDAVHYEGRALVWPGAPRLKLWRDSLLALGRSNEGLERDHFRKNKFHAPSTGSVLRDPVRLRAIYLLEWGELSLTRLTGLKSLSRLVAASAYRPDLLEAMGLVEATWQHCTKLIQSAPVRLLSRPKDWSRMQAVIDRLVQDW